MTKMYFEADAHPAALHGKRITIIGYGSQGKAQAQNLRDSGFDVTIGLRPQGKTWIAAQADGFKTKPFADATQDADVVMILTPDLVQKAIWEQDIAPHIKPGAMLMFSHGFNIHYGLIKPPSNIDVTMVAPKSPGRLVRTEYQKGAGVPGLVAVHQDATGTAFDRALAYAHGIGCTRAGVLQTSFAEETETDLFGEQAVLCGGATELVAAGFDTLVKAGYQPEVAYYECLHELKLIVDLLYEGGFARMHDFVSDTAKYGDLSRGPRVVDAGTRERMAKILDEIRSGEFAREWIAEHESGGKRYRALMEADLAHPIEKVGAELRAHMRWLPGNQQAEAANTSFTTTGGGALNPKAVAFRETEKY